MKKNFYLLFAAFAAITSVISCEEAATSEDEVGGTLVLSVDNSSLDLDEQEKATFTVEFNGEDVTDEAEIVNISLGGYEPLTSNVFTTFRPGTHSFIATYKNAVSAKVDVLGVTETGLSSIYFRRNIVFKFTGTWCGFCPNASSAIKTAQILYPDRLVEVAIHQGDELEVKDVVNTWSTLVSGVGGYPTVCVDANSDYKGTGSPVASNIVTQAQASLTNEPTTVGIKLQSTLEDHKLTVDVESHIVEEGDYKIVVVFLQSGFNYEQTGTSDPNYRQNHVVRWFFTESKAGDLLGEADGHCVVGERIKNQYVVDLDADVKLTPEVLDTFEIVAFIMKNTETGRYHVNNATTVGIGELSDYKYEPIVE